MSDLPQPTVPEASVDKVMAMGGWWIEACISGKLLSHRCSSCCASGLIDIFRSYLPLAKRNAET